MTDIKTLAETVLKYSPTVATALGGPIAGMVATLLSHAFGVDTDSLPSTIATDPDAAVKIQQFELQYKAELAQANAANYQAEVNDRKNSRDLASRLDKHFWILPTLSIIFVVSYFGFILLKPHLGMSDSDAHQTQDNLTNCLMLILAFWFGSCHGNK
jgi:hypothetical protein